MKGYLTLSDFEHFFLQKLRLDVDQNFIERYYLSIDKADPNRLSFEELRSFLATARQV